VVQLTSHWAEMKILRAKNVLLAQQGPQSLSSPALSFLRGLITNMDNRSLHCPTEARRDSLNILV
jgi:hypothetical protein